MITFIIGFLLGMIFMDYLYYTKTKVSEPYYYYIKLFFKNSINYIKKIFKDKLC